MRVRAPAERECRFSSTRSRVPAFSILPVHIGALPLYIVSPQYGTAPNQCDEPVRACVRPPAEDGRIGARGTIGGGRGRRSGWRGGWRREGGETERAMVREESSNGDFTDFHGGNASRSERCGRCVQVELTRHRISSFPPRKKARDPLLYSTILLSLVVLLLLLLAKHIYNNG